MGRLIVGVNDLATVRPDLLKEWDYEKNALICSPDEITLGSNKKVWWVCSKGHEWQSTVPNRVNNHSGCPYCSGRRTLKGINDFASQKAALLIEWNYEKNGIDPSEISFKSGKKVWWKCSKCGKEWRSSIVARGTSLGCRECALIEGGKKRRINSIKNGAPSLFESHPNLAKEWNYEKNEINPKEITASYFRKVWWKCDKGHEWQQTPSVRSRGIGCPYCSGRLPIKGINDLLTVAPELASEWDYEKNGDKRPEDYKPQSNAKVWWKCERGHEWQTSICNRYKGRKCPECSKALKTSFPEQAVLYYLSQLYDVSSRTMINGWEVDIYISNLNIGIEYDGLYYHDNAKARSREKRKDKDVLSSGVKLFHIKETKDKNCVDNTNIYYSVDNKYSGLKTAINSFLDTIGENRTIDIDVVRDWQTIKSSYWNIFLDNNIENTHPDLCKEWNYEKNNSLMPNMFSAGSHNILWWKCSKGHEWQATVADRTGGNGCPYCSGRLPIKGVNDLLTINPELASEWDYEKNGELKPDNVSANSSRIIWWKCKNGHSWKQTVNNRAKGVGCPYCSGRAVIKGVNDLATVDPLLIKEWDYEKNEIVPTDIHSGSHTKVWWKCSKCGYEWEASVENRTRQHTNCPVCSGREVVYNINSLEWVNPEVSRDWDYNKNKPLTPKEIHYGSNRKVWWKCSKCGYEWSTAVAHRTGADKTGCPKCKGQIGNRILCIETNTIFENLGDAAKFCNGSKGNIVRCCKGRGKTAYGYHWEYVD